MCPGAVDNACNVLRLCPDAMAVRKAVLTVKSIREALAMGSKGRLARASNTLGRLQEGSNFLSLGRLRKKALNNFVKGRSVRHDTAILETLVYKRYGRPIRTYSRQG